MEKRKEPPPIRVPRVASAISPTSLPTPPPAPGQLFQPQKKALAVPRAPASLTPSFPQMQEGGAESQLNPTSRVDEGEGRERAWPGEQGAQGGHRAGQVVVVENQRASSWGSVSSSC